MSNLLPRRTRGRQTASKQAEYEQAVAAFCATLKEIASRLDFRVSSRGWCYLLENRGAITKSEFDAAQTLINDCRKAGLLPLNFCAEDVSREFDHVEDIDEDDTGDYAVRLVRSLRGWCDDYIPVSFWADKPVYIQMLVEKIDLRELFAPTCAEYRIPIANGKGWSDINQRAEMMGRFAEHDAEGRRCVLLYCGDHDPAGLRISDAIKETMAQLTPAVGWDPGNLIVDRFGLNYDFIRDNRLSWIENLETGGRGKVNDLADPTHPDHGQPYVQNYLAQYGPRKVEANALVVVPEAGRKLCLDAILRWLPDQDAPDRYTRQLQPIRQQAWEAVQKAMRA